LVKLLGYDFSIEYKKGVENAVADALSRIVEHGELAAISHPIPHWLEPIQEEVATKPQLQELVRKIEEDEAVGPWEYKGGLIYFKNRIYLEGNSTLIPMIIREYHSSTHEGFHKTIHRIRSVFYWAGMRNQIRIFIQECDVCQRHKAATTHPNGLLQPLPIPEVVWTDISMDFIDGLPTSKGKITIFVVIDRLSKYGHFTPINHPYIAPVVAQVFFENIFKLHGIPKTIVCNRDPAFTSSFWKELFRLNGVQFNFSSAYHPQTDGQTEVVNRTIEMYLRCFTSSKPSERVQWLP
jgi:hypothetical protein